MSYLMRQPSFCARFTRCSSSIAAASSDASTEKPSQKAQIPSKMRPFSPPKKITFFLISMLDTSPKCGMV